MGKRKAISKKTRFEVFKRDKFTCQYCGRTIPDVVLHIDHIKPVSKGGTNDIMNLITSCSECNLGKGARELSDDSVIKKQQKQLKLLADKNEQLEMMLKWRDELQAYSEKELNAVNQRITNLTNWELSDYGRQKVKRLVKEFTIQVVLDAVDIAFEKYYDGTENSWQVAFDKIGGICFNRTRKDSDLAYYYNYLRKACRERFYYVNENTLKRLVKDYIRSDTAFEEIKDILDDSANWSDFYEKVDGRFW